MKNPFQSRNLTFQPSGIVIPLFLFIITFIPRLALIGKGFYHQDTLYLYMKSCETLATGHLQYLYLHGYPMTVLWAALFVTLGEFFNISNPAWPINFMSVLFSSFSVLFFYLIVKILWNRLTALISALVLTCHPIFLAVSVWGNNHTPSMFSFFIGLYLLILYRKTQRRSFLVLSALSIGLMAASRLQDIILLLPLSYLFFVSLPGVFEKQPFQRKPFTSVNQFVLFLLIIFIVLIAFYFPTLVRGQSSQSLLSTFKTLDTYPWIIIRGYSLSIIWFSARYILLSFSPLGSVIILLGGLLMAKKSLKLFWLILLWALPSLICFGGFSTVVPRYYLNVIIPLAIVQGYLLSKISNINRYFPVVVAFIMTTLILLTFSNIYPILLFRHQHDLMGDFGRWIQTQTEPNAQIIILDEQTIIDHYSQRVTIGPPLIKYSFSKYTDADVSQLKEYLKTLKQKLESGIPVYITDSTLTAYDPEQWFSKALRTSFKIETVGRFPLEEWHQGETTQILFWQVLYRIKMAPTVYGASTPSP